MGRRGLPGDVSCSLQLQQTAVASGAQGKSGRRDTPLHPRTSTVGSGGEERSGARAAGVKMLVGIWGWAMEHISEMF